MATAIIIDELNHKTKSIKSFDYSITTIKDPQRLVEVREILPFRVKFSSVQIQDVRGMIPAIPLQVIGYSNYIL
jgi:hypothetical protein